MPPQRSEWQHTPSEAVMAMIIPWDRGLGVSYTYSNGDAEAGPIGPEDWPVIRVLESEGKVSFTSKHMRQRFAKLRKFRLKHS
jgi:hypothetical protein